MAIDKYHYFLENDWSIDKRNDDKGFYVNTSSLAFGLTGSINFFKSNVEKS